MKAFISPIAIVVSSPLSVGSSITTTKHHERVSVKLKQKKRIQIRATSLTEDNGTSASPSLNKQPEENEVSYRLTAAERARTLVYICKSATLCTASARHEGIPFGSHVDFIQDEQGNPVFLLAANANHTRNLANEPRCSLFCQPSSSAGQDGCRVTLVGEMKSLCKENLEDLRQQYEDTHMHAKEALRYEDLFKFYTMVVKDVLFVSGYGVMSQWVDDKKFEQAVPDSLAFESPGIIRKLNEEKEDDLKRLCRVFLGLSDVGKVGVTGLDRLGFDVRVRNDKLDTQEYRVAFREIVSNRFDVQSALVKVFQEAWERENGFDETWQHEQTRPTVLYYSRV